MHQKTSEIPKDETINSMEERHDNLSEVVSTGSDIPSPEMPKTPESEKGMFELEYSVVQKKYISK